MKRKNFITTILVGASSGALLSSCANESSNAKQGSNADSTSAGPKALRFGKPAPTTPRDVVDNSFSYYLLVTFNTMDDINTYEHHPIHLGAVDKFSKYWTKVQVKDAILM